MAKKAMPFGGKQAMPFGGKKGKEEKMEKGMKKKKAGASKMGAYKDGGMVKGKC
jgi:hypothetical protein